MPSWDTLLANTTCVSGLFLFLVLPNQLKKVFLMGSPFYTQMFSLLCCCRNKSDVIVGGKTEDEMVRVDILENQSMDFRNGFVRLCYGDFVSSSPLVVWRSLISAPLLKGLLASLTPRMGKSRRTSTICRTNCSSSQTSWEKGSGLRVIMYACVCCMNSVVVVPSISEFQLFFSLSQQITFVDFIMYELLDQHRMFHPTCLDNFANLKKLMENFEASTCEQYEPGKSQFWLFVAVSPGVAVHRNLSNIPVFSGSGQNCCLHEVGPIHQDSCQQQNGQMGKQKRVTVT